MLSFAPLGIVKVMKSSKSHNTIPAVKNYKSYCLNKLPSLDSSQEAMRYKGGFLKIGHWESEKKYIGDREISMFAELSGDMNPLHLDSEYASTTIFKKRIAHGMLSALLIPTIAGMKMPGPGSIYVNQNLKFNKPVFIEDTVTAVIVIKSIREKKRLVTMDTTVYNQLGEAVITGEAMVLAPPHLIENPN